MCFGRHLGVKHSPVKANGNSIEFAKLPSGMLKKQKIKN